MESEDISFSDVLPLEIPPGEEDEVEQETLEEDQTAFDTSVSNTDTMLPQDTKDAKDTQSPLKKTRKLKSEVKKCSSKWILFSTEERPKIMAEFPHYQFSDIAKEVAERYRNISAHDSERLDNLVSEDKERYRLEMSEAHDDPITTGAEYSIMNPCPTLAFPLSKVRKACKLDPEVKAISRDAVPLITKAVELFVGFLARRCAYTVSLRGQRSIREQDLIQTIFMHESLEFMRIDFPRKPSSSTKQKVDSTTPKHRSVPTSGNSENTVGRGRPTKTAPEPVEASKSIAQFFSGGGLAGKRSLESTERQVDNELQSRDKVPDQIINNENITINTSTDKGLTYTVTDTTSVPNVDDTDTQVVV